MAVAHATKEKRRQYLSGYRSREKDRINGHRLKYRYGITLAQHKAMMEKQEGKCAICKEGFDKTPHVDHCHKSKFVRGLLCDRCNRGIGYFRENREFLISAAEYLDRFDL